MEKLAQTIAQSVCRNLSFDDEKQRVIAYGLSALFQMIIIWIVITVVGVWGGFYPEALILFFGVGFLRRSTGGNHAPTFNSCLLISIVSICLLAAIAHYVPNQNNALFFILLAIVGYMMVFYLIYKLAPVDSPNKRIVNPQKVKKLRRSSMLTALLYLILTVFFLIHGLKKPTLFTMGVSFTFASIWQALTLTKWSKVFLNLLLLKIEQEGKT